MEQVEKHFFGDGADQIQGSSRPRPDALARQNGNPCSRPGFFCQRISAVPWNCVPPESEANQAIPQFGALKRALPQNQTSSWAPVRNGLANVPGIERPSRHPTARAASPAPHRHRLVFDSHGIVGGRLKRSWLAVRLPARAGGRRRGDADAAANPDLRVAARPKPK